MAIVLDPGSGANLIHKEFLLQAWKDSINSIKSTLFQTTSHEFVKTESIVPLLIRTGDLRVSTLFRSFENLAVKVLLGTTFIDRCIRSTLPNERKVVFWHLNPVVIISTKKAFNTITAINTVINVITHSQDGTSNKELDSCHVVR